DQTPGQSDAGLPGISLGLANDSGYRNGEHDSQRADSLVGKEQHPRTGCIHIRSIQSRNRCLTIGAPRSLLVFSFDFATLPLRDGDPAMAIQKVHELADKYGILFG